MKLKHLILIIITLLWASHSAQALSGLKLLTVEPGARPTGMGGAFTAVISDPYSPAYNPAASYGVGPLRGSVGHNEYWQNIRIETGYFSFMKDEIYFSTGLQFAVVGDMQERSNIPTTTANTFDAHDISFKMGAAFPMTKDVIFGAMAGWAYEKIQVYSGSAFNVDLGLLAIANKDLTFGLAVLNLGSRIQLREEQNSLPITYRAGAAYRIKEFLPAADIVIQDDKFHLHLGSEYQINNSLFLRAGYRIGYDSKDFSAGAGFAYRNFRIDYAFIPYKNDLGDSHLINLNFHL